ncbi:MAG TPA: transferase hexapeptide repeat family protein [Burkholderiaceae bacterium]|nr:transferase hexapeptide repeat family protein [Burkholderiaceae bacterium]
MQPPLVYRFEGITPVIDPTAFVHPSAVLIGDVVVGPRCYVAAGAVMRGDFGRIVLEAGANLQDNCVVHSLDDFDCVMEADAHIGHGAVIHGCRIGRDALVGMNAVVMDRAVVGEQAIVAAMAFVKIGGRIPPRVLAAGVPAKVVRELTDADLRGKHAGTLLYQELAVRSAATMEAVEALPAAEPDRRRSDWSGTFARLGLRG